MSNNWLWIAAVKVVSTHMFEGVMGHRHSSSLLQVVIPVEVEWSWVSIWNTHTHHISLFHPAFQNILSYSFHAAVHRVVLTRLRWLLTHPGAPSRPRLGALRRNREGLLSSKSKWMSAGPKLMSPWAVFLTVPHSAAPVLNQITIHRSQHYSVISELTTVFNNCKINETGDAAGL